MGQMTFALMLGCKMPKEPRGKRWWGDSEQVNGEWVYQDGLLEMYKPPRGKREPKTDENNEVLGIYVAVGASGADGCPDLEGPINVADVMSHKRYAKSIQKAWDSWRPFAAFCKEQGVTLPDPHVWLVEVEVA
jgi:hypothetical protein